MSSLRQQYGAGGSTASADDVETGRPGRTARLVRSEIRRAVADEYRREVLHLLKWRHLWKKTGDFAEAFAKGLAGASTVLAFAASSNISQKTTDVLAFTSGCVGTLSLVLLGYSSYATRESQQRTSEMNIMLGALEITPVPDIASQDAVRAGE